MSYLKGEKFEEESKRQLRLLGVDTKKSIHSLIKENGDAAGDNNPLALSSTTTSWKTKLSSLMSNFVSVDLLFSIVRLGRRVALWSQNCTVKAVKLAATLPVVSQEWKEWADSKHNLLLQNSRLDWTEEAIHALLDVHGYQILNQVSL